MGRRFLAVATCALAWPGLANAAWTKSDQMVPASDGTQLATSLYVPAGAPPAGGRPAIVMFHGIGGTRASMNMIAEQTFANQGFVVLTADHRGHGQSGGLFNVNGSSEIQDARDLYDWLAARPGVDRAHIGAFGISLGGGVVLGALKAGVPFAAAEVLETWVDLPRALAPGRLAKSGAIFQFLNSVAPDRTAPELNGLKSSFLTSTSYAAIRSYGDARSTLSALPRINTPTFIFQGRRDFAFGLEQGIAAYRKLGGPKRLYIGDFGHAPSTFPGPDASVVFAEASAWFDRFLKNKRNGIDTRKPVELAPDPYVQGKNVSYVSLPPTTNVRTATVAARKTFGSRGKVVLSFKLPNRKLEVFGAPVVTVKASTRSQARQLTAVVEAVEPGGAATIVSEGGTLLPTRGKAWTLSFPLISDTALIAPRSKLRVTLSWTTTAQNPLNLLYLTGVPDGSSLTIRSARVTLPVLRSGISV